MEAARISEDVSKVTSDLPAGRRLTPACKGAGRICREAGNMNKVLAKLDRWSAVLFYLGLCIEILVVVLDKSSWTNPYDGMMYRFAFVLFAVRCLFCVPRATAKEHGFWLLGILLGVLCWRIGGRNDLLRVLVFMRAAGTISIRKAMKLEFLGTLAGCAALVVLALAGVMGHLYQTYDYGHGIETRWDLGLGHPNSLHCMAAMLLMLGLYLYDRKMKLYLYILLAVGDVLLYGLTHSNTACAMALFSICFSMVLHYGRRVSRAGAVYLFGELLVAGGLVFSILCGLFDPRKHSWMARLDSVLTGRVASLWTTTFHEGTISTWKWFSQRLNVTYFDLGWLRVVYWYGILPALFIVGVVFLLMEHSRRTRDRAGFVLLLSMSLYTVFEAHLVSAYIGRNYGLLLAALYLSEILGRGKELGDHEPEK